MGNARRLATGFGIIALGVGAALPFRRPVPRSLTGNRPLAEAESQLAVDLPLQVPGPVRSSGATGSPPLSPVARQPQAERAAAAASDAVQDSASGGAERDTGDGFAVAAQSESPPAMPNQYQSLLTDRRVPRQPTQQRPDATSQRNPPPFATPVKRHTIRDGDTLASLALRYYGDESRGSAIYAANRDALSHPDVLPIGVDIVIPRDGQPVADATPAEFGQVEDAAPADRLVPLPADLFHRAR